MNHKLYASMRLMNNNDTYNEITLDAMGSFLPDDSSDVPLWIQIRRRLVFLITSGKYQPGQRMPSVRELSVRLGVNYNTINKIYKDLERDNYIYTKRGLGTYVSDIEKVCISPQDSNIESIANDFVQQALIAGMTENDIHDLISAQIHLLLNEETEIRQQKE